ncbi:MAG: zinc-binding dehydrogenase [Planctomycetota bacterium]
MDSRVVVVRADEAPQRGIERPGPHQTYKNPRVSVERRRLPRLHPDDIRVEMLYAGICGTDVHLATADPATGYILGSAPARIPRAGRVMGHEGVGRVVEIGRRVRHIRPGAYVAFESIVVCHYCDACRRGNFNQCRNSALLGMERDGIFGDVVDVPSLIAHDVSDLAGSERGRKSAACIEPAAIAFVACQNAGLAAGDVAVIFGAGPIGYYAAMLGRAVFGASEVHVVEKVPFRRAKAGRWSDAQYDVPGFEGRGPADIDVAIEASGAMENIRRCITRLRPNGRIVILGRGGEPLRIDATDHMITNEISLKGSRGHLGGAFASIIALCRKGRLRLDDAVTGIVHGPEGVRRLLENPRKLLEAHCKVLVKFGRGCRPRAG